MSWTTDSLFTIEASVALLSLKAEPGGEGLLLSWSTEPQVGPQGLSGYRIYRLGHGEQGSGLQIGPSLITETSYIDADGVMGQSYRLVAVNGLAGELEMGRISFEAPFVGLRAWPSPVPAAGSLNIQFAIPLGSAGLPAADLKVAVFDIQGRRAAAPSVGFAAKRKVVVVQ